MDDMDDDANVPVDAVAINAEEVVKAAIAWRWTRKTDEKMSREEWRLFDACNSYGDRYVGTRAG